MYETKRRSMSFDVMDKDEVKKYEEILNDPLCTITSNNVNNTSRTIFSDEGKPLEKIDILIRTIEWDEKHLL
jgi:hypothetical protein